MNDFTRKWAAGLRALIVRKLNEHGPLTTNQLAGMCNVSVEAIAPRMTELEAEGLAHDTGRRVASGSGLGRKLKVWQLTTEETPARLTQPALL